MLTKNIQLEFISIFVCLDVALSGRNRHMNQQIKIVNGREHREQGIREHVTVCPECRKFCQRIRRVSSKGLIVKRRKQSVSRASSASALRLHRWNIDGERTGWTSDGRSRQVDDSVGGRRASTAMDATSGRAYCDLNSSSTTTRERMDDAVVDDERW